ncbi:MAG: energy-coupling factor transporter transmembrane protein EcfT, partial [Oscillospiraceae bacterium]|nr:energy-coupling factor transporter transmembrane protein EcfT [Oscillospiraceae bacterium]
MLKDVTLGQYFPGDTPMHRLDPRTKIILLLVYIVALFSAHSFIQYGVVSAALIVCVALARLRLKTMLSGVKPLFIIIIFTGILNVFYTKGTVIAEFWIFSITKEGLRAAAFMILRIV